MQKYVKHTLCLMMAAALMPVQSAPVWAADSEIPADVKDTDSETREKDATQTREPSAEQRTEVFMADPAIPVVLLSENGTVDTLMVRPRLGRIYLQDLFLPEGISLKNPKSFWKVPANGEPLKLQAQSENESTKLIIHFTKDGQDAGTCTLTRAVVPDGENQVAFNLEQADLPDNTTWNDPDLDMVRYVPYGQEQTLDVEIKEKPASSTLNLTLILSQSEQTIRKQIRLSQPAAQEEAENGTDFRLEDSLPPYMQLANPQDSTKTVPAGETDSSAEVETVLSEDVGLVDVLYTDKEGKNLATVVYTVPTEEHNPVTIDLNQVDLDLPAGYTPKNQQTIVEVVPGQIVHASMPLTNLIEESLLNVEYVEDGVPVGDEIITKKVPSLDGTVTYSARELSVPAGYKLSDLNLYSSLTGKYAEETSVKLKVEPSDLRAVISYVNPKADNEVVETQTFSSKDGLLLPSDLQIPEGYSLNRDFEPTQYEHNGHISVPVVLDDESDMPATFSITYEAAAGPAGQQKKVKLAEEEQAVLSAADLELPTGYALEKPFEEVAADPGEDKKLTVGVMRDETNPNEAVFEVDYVDDNGKTVATDSNANQGKNDTVLSVDDLNLPPGYKLAEDFQTVTGNAGDIMKVTVKVTKDNGSSGTSGGDSSTPGEGSKQAIFKITYKDTDGNTIDTQTVTFDGTDGSASLEKTDLKVPSGYKIKGSYTAPTCAYGRTLSIEIKVEKSDDTSAAPSTDTSSDKAEAVLEVIYYVQDGSDKKTVKKETFKSEDTGEKGKEYIFEKDKTYTIKAPNGYTIIDSDIAKKVSVDYGYSGTLEVKVKITDVHTAAQTDKAGMEILFTLSLAGFAGLAWMKKKEQTNQAETDAGKE